MKKFFYRVKKGDTVLKLSFDFCMPPVKLISLNNLKTEICEGDLLYIEVENYTVYTVALTDTVNSIATRFNTSPEKILLDNGVSFLFYCLKIIV
jgi:LysM repeat protein